MDTPEKITEVYQAGVRHEMRDGDVLLFRGRGFRSAVVRWLTKSDYSHVGLVVRHSDRVLCAQATGKGVHVVVMSHLVKHYDGGIEYFVSSASDEQRRVVLNFVFGKLGTVYDYASGVRFALALLTKRMGKHVEDDKWFCSELVAKAYQLAGFPLVDGRPSDYVSPADLRKSSRLEYRSTLLAE